MPSGQERLHTVKSEESEVFVTDCRHLYLDVASKLAISPKVESALTVIASSPAKKYIEVCQTALNDHTMIMIVAQGSDLQKLVSVVEQVKSNSEGRISQMNKCFTQLSLINPSYAAQHSMKNVQIFFGDDVEGKAPAEDALKEIKGHKVYDVPCMSVVLAKGDIESSKTAFSEWSVQVKGQ